MQHRIDSVIPENRIQSKSLIGTLALLREKTKRVSRGLCTKELTLLNLDDEADKPHRARSGPHFEDAATQPEGCEFSDSASGRPTPRIFQHSRAPAVLQSAPTSPTLSDPTNMDIFDPAEWERVGSRVAATTFRSRPLLPRKPQCPTSQLSDSEDIPDAARSLPSGFTLALSGDDPPSAYAHQALSWAHPSAAIAACQRARATDHTAVSAPGARLRPLEPATGPSTATGQADRAAGAQRPCTAQPHSPQRPARQGASVEARYWCRVEQEAAAAEPPRLGTSRAPLPAGVRPLTRDALRAHVDQLGQGPQVTLPPHCRRDYFAPSPAPAPFPT
jgi:hypothetical protein